jgi:hypothetical protein
MLLNLTPPLAAQGGITALSRLLLTPYPQRFSDSPGDAGRIHGADF